MSSGEKEQKRMTRREFVKGAAVGAAAVAGAGVLAGCQKETPAPTTVPTTAPTAASIGAQECPPCPVPWLPEKWDYEADVVVVGYGGAGATAAMEAHDAGAEVLILEKAPADLPGGNTGCCAGYILPPSNVPDGIKYYRALGFGTVTDEELIRTFVEALMGVSDWLESLGAPITIIRREGSGAFPTLPGSKVDVICVDGGGHVAFKILSEEVESRGITVMNETPAKRLIQDAATAEIVGVIAEEGGREISVKARRGVVLACGGYENNAEMQGYFNFPGLRFYPWGTPYNTGDGIKMASAVGANLWHMPSLEWTNFAIKAPSDLFDCAVSFSYSSMSGSYIFVNKYGKRFMEETKSLGHYKGTIETCSFDHKGAEYPNIPFYLIFDETFREQSPLVPKHHLGSQTLTWAIVHKLCEWSEDNSKEIEKGWIIKADTIEELAKKIGIDAMGLAEAVSTYNEYCALGEDTEFGRAAENSSPIKTPPYYATELCLANINTQGGPVHDAGSRVLDVNSKPIPRLYAAGELGSFFGHLYQGGNNFPEALAFGRIAGKNASAEEPWG